MECKRLYKSRPIISASDFSAKLSQNLNAERQEKRREFFWGSRVVLNEPSGKCQPAEKKKNTRAEMLQKWKAEKIKRLEEQKKNQKPIFKVGIVQRKVTGSPLIKQRTPNTKNNLVLQQAKSKAKTPDTNIPGVLTRAKAKHMVIKPKFTELKPVVKAQKVCHNKCYKTEEGKKKQIESHVFKVPEAVLKLPYSNLTFPCSPKLMRKSRKSVKLEEEEIKIKPQIKEQTEPKSNKLEVKSMELKKKMNHLQEENSEKPKMTLQPTKATPEKAWTDTDDYRSIHYSPFVTVRSGKKCKKKSKKSLTIDVDEQIKKEEDEFKCRIFSFRKYIECETKRLLEMCDKWKHIYEEFQEIPTEIEGDIDSAIGKTNLLTSDKFLQFKGLIEKCENGDSFVKVDDLQGFQDWVSIEVERIDKEFHRLEKLKCNNWKWEAMPVDISKVQKIKAVKNTVKKPVGKSNIRSHILAARKLLQEGNASEASHLPTFAFDLILKATTPKKKESFLKNVLNSEMKKKNNSSTKKSPALRQRRNSGLEIMIASQKNKFPTPTKKSPLVTNYEILVEKNETPSRSILKKTPKTLNSSKGHVTFENNSENLIKLGRGLSEKYFRPLSDDDGSPFRTILGDLGNFVSSGVNTRSKTRQRSCSTIRSPQVN